MRASNLHMLSAVTVILVMIITASCGKNEAGATDSFSLPEMIRVPAGTFLMGSNNRLAPAGPEHLVTISDDYEIGKYEVCNREYCDMLNYALGKGLLTSNHSDSYPIVRNREGQPQNLLMLGEKIEGIASEIQFDKTTSRFVVEKGKERRPVVYVSWYGAAFYCNVLSEKQGLIKMYNLSHWKVELNPAGPGYRIPTEAEWEYAVRFDESTNVAVSGRSIPWGWPWPMGQKPTTAEFQQYANFNYASGKGGTKDVGSYENGKSKLGLYDMAGNVSEWNQDYLAVYKPHAQTNPVEISSGCYLQRRGGGWLYYANNMPYTTYHMDCNYAYVYYVDLGFRVVKTGMKLNPITN
ncbi:MAG: SUMF1/EgtB/PvdO family nonheme iron enzyme [Kiritimatiellae bacterium]|nr:SUMF1/EgtB/PvdO family nonheme iron enzyme [Kiritimatiellia bacterium]MDD5519737.1 SUMF1/EgtB/PvdO family nonheme iron enzyme [Kiritimatiellia bacterium]